jgi:hypothetical protein
MVDYVANRTNQARSTHKRPKRATSAGTCIEGSDSTAQLRAKHTIDCLVYVADRYNNTIRMGIAQPVIVSQPQGQTINSGSTTVFTVVATGASSYQWQLNGINLTDGASGSATVAGSKGSQLLLTGTSAANAGAYTCIVTYSPMAGASASITTGPAILAITNDANPGSVTSISSRAFVGTGDNILIGGFYIVGSTSATVLVQAIGPALAVTPYNVTGTLQKPALTIHQSQNGKDVVLYSNTGWGSSSVLLAATAAVYAQPVLQPNAADSEVLLTLPPGGYTAEVTGADGGMIPHESPNTAA